MHNRLCNSISYSLLDYADGIINGNPEPDETDVAMQPKS